MKQNLLLALIIATGLTSCQKEEEGQPALEPPKIEQNHAVTFNVSDFDQSFKKLSATNPGELGKFADVLHYMVYNSAGVLIHTKTQRSNQSNFGSITDSLLAGNYTAIFVAVKEPGYIEILNQANLTNLLIFYGNGKRPDHFLKKVFFTHIF